MKPPILIALCVLALVSVSSASGAPSHPLTCFGAPTGCTSDGKTATIDTNANAPLGVYLAGLNPTFYGVRTSAVTKLSNTVSGATSLDPHWLIPIDDRADTTYDLDYALEVPLGTCSNGAGFVNVIADSTCAMWKVTGEHYEQKGDSYPNWAAFVAANPSTYISANAGYAFIYADYSGPPGIWTISNVQVGKPGK